MSGLRAEEGITLVETLIAVFILSIGLLAIGSTAFAGLRAMSESQLRQRATAMATESIEVARSYDFPLIANRAGEEGVPDRFDHRTGTPVDPGDREAIIATASGAVIGAAHRRVEEGLTLYTFVTQPDGDLDSRRVTALVSYRGTQGDERWVRFSTIVADAERGLGQPQFDVIPPTSTTRQQRGSEPACFTHELTNRGNRDRYSIELPVGMHDVAVYSHDVDEPDVRESLGPTSPYDLPKQPDEYIETDESVGLTICYDVPLDFDEDDSPLETSVVVRSQFLPDRVQPLSHTVVVDLERTLYLYPEVGDEGEITDQAWDGLRSFAMSSSAPNNVPLRDYDLDGDGDEGLRLQAADTSTAPKAGEAARFDYRIDELRTIREASLRAWVRRSDEGADPSIWLRLEHLPIDGDPVEWSDPEPLPFVSVSSSTWSMVALSIPLVGDLVLEPGDGIRLTVGCLEDGTDGDDPFTEATTADCALAFGTSTYASSLTVGFP